MSLVGTPTVFDQVVVTGETFNPATETQAKMSITGIDATGIAGIRFLWPDGQENGAVGYSELDVFGSPIPEPSSALLLGLSSLALLRRRRS